MENYTSIKLKDELPTQFFHRKNQKIKIIGNHGSVVLTLSAGYWSAYEYPMPLTRFQKVLRFLRLYKQKYMIRASRVK